MPEANLILLLTFERVHFAKFHFHIVFFREILDWAPIFYCGRPWPAAYINFNQNTHQIQVLTKPLCHAQAIFYSLPNNEWGTIYRGLTYSAM